MSLAELVSGWWAWLAPASVQAGALLAGAWLIDRALRRRVWPQLLSAMWLVALARLLAPRWPTSAWSVTGALGARAAVVANAAPSGAAPGLLAGAWLVGAVCCALLRWRQRRGLARRIMLVDISELGASGREAHGIDANGLGAWNAALRDIAVTLRLRRGFRVGILKGLATPAVTGAWHPIVLVPSDWLERAPTLRDRHALLHELTHVARGDLWLDELCQAVRALFWFHPLVWIAVRRVGALSEIACDADVARALGRGAADYRDTLVLAARDALADTEVPVARAFFGNRSQILTRLEHLQRGPGTSRRCARLAGCAVALLLATCVLPTEARPQDPRADLRSDLRTQAQAVLDQQRAGSAQSCFSLHAAASVLSAAPESASPVP